MCPCLFMCSLTMCIMVVHSCMAIPLFFDPAEHLVCCSDQPRLDCFTIWTRSSSPSLPAGGQSRSTQALPASCQAQDLPQQGLVGLVVTFCFLNALRILTHGPFLLHLFACGTSLHVCLFQRCLSFKIQLCDNYSLL
jgi:hypothetical protein